GYYKNAKLLFLLTFPKTYPHESPKVVSRYELYHPNIDTTGPVCLNILRLGWTPVLCLNAIIYGLINLLMEPNIDEPLNKEAANTLKNNLPQFISNCEKCIKKLKLIQ
ncbi:hypothetical protein A3Q56_07883, partial [Intoshia linei]